MATLQPCPGVGTPGLPHDRRPHRSSTAWLALGMLALAGNCAPARGYYWAKNVGPDEQRRDAYECERDTRAAALSFGGGLVGAFNAQDFNARCMEARGYVLQAVQEPQPPRHVDYDFARPLTPTEIETSRSECMLSCDMGDPMTDVACRDTCWRSYPKGK